MLSSARLLIAVNFLLSAGVALMLGGHDLHESPPEYSLTVTCDGPTILGGTTTFVATLGLVGARDTSEEEQYLYIWGDPRDTVLPVTIVSDTSCTFNTTFFSEDDIGIHTMRVEVFNPRKIAGGTIPFEVTDHIPATVIASQNGMVCLEGLCNAATNQPVLLTVGIHDPSGYLDSSIFLFDWYFGDGEQMMRSTLMSVPHKYKMIGQYPVRVDITAIAPTRQELTGRAHLNIQALDAIQNLTVDGVDHVVAREEKRINVSCHGSPPVSFCWRVSDNITSNTITDERCLQSYLLEKCRMVIDYQFNDSKQYTLSVRASNDVSSESLVLSVEPKSPPDMRPEGIAGAVIAIVLGLLLTGYSISVIARQVQKSRRRHVEVANFNFEASSSFDFIKEHAKHLNSNRAANENTPLLNRDIPLDVRWGKGDDTLEL